jgi:hypothetical protein
MISLLQGILVGDEDSAIVSALCQIVDAGEPIWAVEDVVDLLGDLGDARAVPSLSRVLVDEPEWDFDGFVGEKAIDSLERLASCTFTAAGSCDFLPTLFANSGTYLLDFDPAGLNAASFNAVLSTDASGTITLDSAPTTVTIARPGQNARYSFSGTAGQLVTVVITGNTLDDGNPGTNNTTAVAIFKPSSPNATPLRTGGFDTTDTGLTLTTTLPETGNYTILMNPSGLDIGTFKLTVR